MEIKSINQGIHIEYKEKQLRKIEQFKNVLKLLRQRQLNENMIATINEHIDTINSASNEPRTFYKQVKKAQTRIVRLIEKEEKLVCKDHYRNTYIAIGIAFGAGIGTALASSTKNYFLTGVGIPFGMIIGMYLGTAQDKKAKEEGRQLDITLK